MVIQSISTAIYGTKDGNRLLSGGLTLITNFWLYEENKLIDNKLLIPEMKVSHRIVGPRS